MTEAVGNGRAQFTCRARRGDAKSDAARFHEIRQVLNGFGFSSGRFVDDNFLVFFIAVEEDGAIFGLK